MRTIAEQNVLLRLHVELPVGLRLTTHEFREGWNFVTGDASRLEKKIRMRGWNFIKDCRWRLEERRGRNIARGDRQRARACSPPNERAIQRSRSGTHRVDAISLVLSVQGKSLSLCIQEGPTLPVSDGLHRSPAETAFNS